MRERERERERERREAENYELCMYGDSLSPPLGQPFRWVRRQVRVRLGVLRSTILLKQGKIFAILILAEEYNWHGLAVDHIVIGAQCPLCSVSLIECSCFIVAAASAEINLPWNCCDAMAGRLFSSRWIMSGRVLARNATTVDVARSPPPLCPNPKILSLHIRILTALPWFAHNTYILVRAWCGYENVEDKYKIVKRFILKEPQGTNSLLQPSHFLP